MDDIQKFAPSCGLSAKEIGIIKFQIKNMINQQIALLPEHVEMKLFLQGTDAWTFRWYLLNKKCPISPKEPVVLDVVVKLKKEFHQYQDTTQYKFSCKAEMVENDLYHPKITIKKIS